MNEIAANPFVQEVLVIDNNHRAGVRLLHPKIRQFSQSRNIFVNPAWNLGAREARGETLCFLNDDLIVKAEVFRYVATVFANSPEIGLVGLKWDRQLGELATKELLERDSHAFGCMIFIRRVDFARIPFFLKIWHGDDYLLMTTLLRKKAVVGLCGFAEREQPSSISTNSIRPAIQSLLVRDSVIWNRFVRRWLLFRYLPVSVASGKIWKWLRARNRGA